MNLASCIVHAYDLITAYGAMWFVWFDWFETNWL